MDGVDALDTASHTHKSGYHDDSDEVRPFLLEGWSRSTKKNVSFPVHDQDPIEAKEGICQTQQLDDCKSWPAQKLGHNFQNRNVLGCK